MTEITRGLQRAALTYALRSGWSESERRVELRYARAEVEEIIASFYGEIPSDLLAHYGDEYAAVEAGYDE